MGKKDIYIGNTRLRIKEKEVGGQFVEIENEKFYKIDNYDQMPDFFVTIVSDSNHWMFISSNGALTAGRKDRNNALFPYYTEDKIHDYRGKTGSKSYLLVSVDQKFILWEPFSIESEKLYSVQRNLYKSIYGNKIIFEEINYDLGLSFQYCWCNSEKFGWIKKSKISNFSESNITVDLLDGIVNILPYGVDYAFQNEYSNLLDAYKKNELIQKSKLGLFMLSAIPVDKAEPSEALKTTTVWSYGLDTGSKVLISEQQILRFTRGLSLETEINIRASRGAYLLNSRFDLAAKESKEWFFAAEVNQDATAVANLDLFISSSTNIDQFVHDDIRKGTQNLIEIVAKSDGLQIGNEDLTCARHFSNTMFNVMRGGVFQNNYSFNLNDFILYLKQANKDIFKKVGHELQQLTGVNTKAELIIWAQQLNDPDLERLCYSYLPLTFSRRHGDPSRPWNQFSIETKNSDGSEKLSYQGNWRDIFQNWEALSLSFPEYIESMLSIFLNASTADGYNPYRITREGLDWERPDPHDPWAYIGYWGDHQIIYLQKLLEQSAKYHPGMLEGLMTKEIFVYANVPYKIKPFDELLIDPKNTIVFDHDLNTEIDKLTSEIGSDGQFLGANNSAIYKVNLTEKILVTLLAKLSNFIPGAGIWLNTQRPEWNDANNALVGNGVSMVTLYYLRRFLKFWENIVQNTKVQEAQVSEEVYHHFFQTYSYLANNLALLDKGFSDENRFRFIKLIGEAASDYRNGIYENSLSGNKLALSVKTVQEFFKLALKFMDTSIQENRREDGLFHSYNLISIRSEGVSIRRLYEMLEGQVAVLSSGYLSVRESLDVFDALKTSKLFRHDQYSYLLYPDRELPSFVEKNKIPKEFLQDSELVKKIFANGNSSIITKDETGSFHFNGNFRNAAVLKDALQKLQINQDTELSHDEIDTILDWYEKVFDHQSFTGRSGTFFAYEGLGSIYWHMVSKLMLACQECYFKGIEENVNPEIVGKLKDHYYELKAGLGLYKSPKLYGAFPTDAYSHTPAGSGAKQPGLTGQVKEDVLTRFGEFGIIVKNGTVQFETGLLNKNEILTKERDFLFFDLSGRQKSIQLKKHQIALTFCQLPVIGTFGSSEKIVVQLKDDKIIELSGNKLPPEISAEIFARSGKVEQIKFYVKV